MSKITLEYFPIRGRAEYIRLVLEEAGASYETIGTYPPTLKSDKDAYPFGQLPRLKDGDVSLVQSYAITRYLARKYNLYGKTNEEQSLADMISDAGEDLRIPYSDAMYTRGDYAAALKSYETTAKSIFGSLEYLLSKNNGGNGYFVGNDVTFADFIVFELLDISPKVLPHILDNLPLLKAFHARVAARPRIAAYIASGRRPNQVNGSDRGN